MFFGPTPWGPGEGSKGQISFSFSYKVNFKDFLYQSLCVFSQIKDIKHIKQDFFVLFPVSCPRVGTWGHWGLRRAPRGQKKFPNIIMWHIKLKGMMGRTECK